MVIREDAQPDKPFLLPLQTQSLTSVRACITILMAFCIQTLFFVRINDQNSNSTTNPQ